jgi:hypothetical protein
LHAPSNNSRRRFPPYKGSLHNPERVFLLFRAKQKSLFFIMGAGEKQKVQGSRETTNVWRKLEIEVLNAAKAAAAQG